MFTGIVTDIGTVTRVESPGDTRVVVATAYDTATVDLGASISCSGVCLTVVDKGPNWFAVDVSGETISRTAKDQWTEGRKFNLERAMKLGDELGGHIVTGHVDGLGTVVALAEEGGSHRVTIRAGADIAPFIAPKGSVTVDGVSLTVNTVQDIDGEVEFGLNIIPHTWSVTTLGTIHVEQSVNIEIDVLARYLQRMEHYRAAAR
ncbi:riboflavin synthase alpha chain [Sphingomonas sp. PP-F2F-A104-K0414]|uniref:riboflavin synthase n=1 Tax=Sphingomonas sp. PP-F2F-A104-K0414 TaxID=2135661 RepID=UPI00104EB608|nr:riboflavin synthase [Sphingomonas sp. PP-F2F-A104-K0414]TCQ01354.1 riboflavin synthase alpha chain [Sphingomonas sp. PP-F2F-A104-K0414]